MVAWQLTQQLQEQLGLDTIIGPTFFESDPAYQHGFHGEETDRLHSNSKPLILLDAVPRHKQIEVLQRALYCQDWAVIVSRPSPEVLEHLDEYSNLHPLPDDQAKLVYQKGWSSTGDKKLFKPEHTLQVWSRHDRPSPVLLHSDKSFVYQW